MLVERFAPLRPRGFRAGVALLVIGVAMDVPPHLLPGEHLDRLALAGHVAVLAGMLVIIVALGHAMAAARNPDRRSS